MGTPPATTPASGTSEIVPSPEVLSLTPLDSAGPNMQALVLSWKPIPGISRFVLCETVPPQGTKCEEIGDVSETLITVAGPSEDSPATGTWLKYLWLQSCGERQCSSPPTPAGAIVHRIAYGANAWNFIVVVRRLAGDQIEVILGNASLGQPKASTLVARIPGGSEIARCADVASGDWCGPFQGALLTNEIAAAQVYEGIAATVEFPVLPSTTAPQDTIQPTP